MLLLFNQPSFLFLFLFFLFPSIPGGGGGGDGMTRAMAEACDELSFGVNYGMVANNLPTPADVVTLLQSICMSKAKLYNADGAVLSTFMNTGISFMVGVPNEDLKDLAASGDNGATAAKAWIEDYVAVHLPGTHIIAIVVGNEVFSSNDTELMRHLVPAMKNIYGALEAMDLHHSILVSTAHSFATVSTSFPPSSGSFQPAIASRYMKPLLDFLNNTSNPFFINVYPFFPYQENPSDVHLDYALFMSESPVSDPATHLDYYNLFDAQLDAVYSAMSALGYHNISVLVSETGWPSGGDSDEHGATVDNAQIYHNNLIAHLKKQPGTPLRPNSSIEVYLFALFNEDLKPGPASERNYGIFRPDGSLVFDFQYIEMSDSPSSFSRCHACSTYPVTILLVLFHFLVHSCYSRTAAAC